MYKDITDYDTATYTVEGASVAMWVSGNAKTGARMTMGVNDTGYSDNATYGNNSGRANATTMGVAP